MDYKAKIYPTIFNPLLIKPARPLPREVAIVGAGTIGPDIGYYFKSALPEIKLFLVDIVEEPLRNAEKRLQGYEKYLHGQLCNFLGGDFKKLRLPSGKFVDAVSFTLGIVVELKPARRRKADSCQLQGYVDELREMRPDINWTGLMMRY